MPDPSGRPTPVDPTRSAGAEGRPIRLMCVDDSVDVIRMLRIAIAREPGLNWVGHLNSADRLVDEAAIHQPDVVLLDLTMPGRDPLAAVAELAATMPGVRVLAFSGFDDADRLDAVVKAGAWGLISKHCSTAEIVAAIRQVASGGLVVPAH